MTGTLRSPDRLKRTHRGRLDAPVLAMHRHRVEWAEPRRDRAAVSVIAALTELGAIGRFLDHVGLASRASFTLVRAPKRRRHVGETLYHARVKGEGPTFRLDKGFLDAQKWALIGPIRVSDPRSF